jgi:glycosyltransferase involved in cell wall biosynthesis
VIANSRWMAELAQEAGWQSVVTIPLATGQQGASEPSAHNDALFFAGRIMRSKGLSFVVDEVLPLLPDNIRVRVAGTVWQEDEARVLEHPRVDYLGKLDADELAREYQAALCTIVPSLAPEGFGLAAVEAAAAGGVVVASNHSGLAEAVLPQAGFLAEAGNAEEWASLIRDIAGWSDKMRRDFLAKAGAAVRKRYSWARVVKDTLALYDAT